MANVATVMAFTHSGAGGNAAGVYLLNEVLTDEQMLAIAAELGYSETVFIQGVSQDEFKFRYFTPTEEVPLCGHATIAAFFFLRERGYLLSPQCMVHTAEGRLSVFELATDHEIIMMEQPKAKIIALDDVEKDLLKRYFGTACNLDGTYKASTGILEVMVQFNSQDALKDLNPDFKALSQLCEQLGVLGVHAYYQISPCECYVRNFAPLLGIDEESATGTSNCALSALLDFLHQACDGFTFYQGMWMAQPSIIYTKKNHSNGSYYVGGSCQIPSKS